MNKLLTIAAAAAVAAPMAVLAIPDDPSTGRTETCTLDTTGCTITHGFESKPTSVTVIPAGPAVLSVNPLTATNTTYRVDFIKHDGTRFASGTVVRFYAHYDFNSAPPPDTTAPDTTITQGPAATTESTEATFEFTSTEPGTFECKLDAGAFEVCVTPKVYTGLAVGTHTFESRATDAAGNTDASPATRAWEITAPPPPPPALKPGMGGTVWQDVDWAGWEAEMGPSENRRTYDGALPSTFEASKAGSANDLEAGRESWWSYKPTITSTGISSAAQDSLRAFLRTVPVGHEFVLTVYHEPEDNIASGAISFQGWLAAQRQAGAIVDEIDVEKGANSKLRYASILMGYWTFDTRGYAGQGWRNLTAADFANVDIIGYDPYKRNANDPSLEQMMTRENSGTLTGTAESAMSNAVSWGKLIAIPEWGVTRTPSSGTVTDAQRATWITDAYNWFKAWNVANPDNPVTDATYFHIDNFYENGTDPIASWEVINIGGGLAEAALRDAMTDSRTP